MNFVDVKNDVAFRKIFGDEKKTEVLVSFLNAVLDNQGDKIITNVTILNPYQFPIYNLGKTTIIDVKARDQSGREYIVEMQVADVTGLSKRMLYYTSRSYTNQIDSGEKYMELNAVILVGIFNFEFTKNRHYLSHHKVLDTETGEQLVEDVEFHFIELPKFLKVEEELNSLVDKWIYFIKNAKDLAVEPTHTDDEGLKAAYDIANKYNWTKKDLEDYDYAAMREQDTRGRLMKAEENALEQGIEQGETKKAEEVAKSALAEGASIAFVAKITGLSIEKVQQIANELSGN